MHTQPTFNPQPTQNHGVENPLAFELSQRAAERRQARGGRPRGIVVGAAIAGAALLGGAAGGGVHALLSDQGGQVQIAQPSTNAETASAPGSLAAVAQSVKESVVTVSVASAGGSGTGSGVVVASGGYIVTNNHVVSLDGRAAQAQITVTTSDGRLLAAELVGTDPAADLAVLRVDAELPVLEFAAAPATGDAAVAVGAPLGLANTVTEGIISATDRGLLIGSSQQEQSPYKFWSERGTEEPAQTVAIPVLQTDAPINPGNSGGALVNASGQLIGINVAIATAGGDAEEAGSIGIGFAIDGALVHRVVTEIIDSGEATHGLLGATISDQTDVSVGVVGATVQEVTDGGAADAAGLKPGDVITALDGRSVTNSTDLTAFVRAAAAGDTVELQVLRGGEELTIEAELGAM